MYMYTVPGEQTLRQLHGQVVLRAPVGSGREEEAGQKDGGSMEELWVTGTHNRRYREVRMGGLVLQ